MQVIVLGGGLMGTATAFFLARRGHRVQLIERGHIGAGATVASFGNIRRTGRYLPQLPLAHRSLALWNRAEELLGQDVEFRATGHLRLIFDAASQADMERFASEARAWGLEIDALSPAEIRRRFPGLGPQAIGASFSPQDGSANPRLVGPAFAQAAARLGVEILDQAGEPDVTRTAAGFRVSTARGTLGAEVLVNCAGAWGREIARQFGEPVPLSTHGPQMAVTEPLPHRILPVVGMWSQDAGAYLRQVERGNVVFGGGVARTPVGASGLAKADPARLETQLRKVVQLCPALADVAIIRQWSGCEGYVADGLPVMGASGTTPGLFHAFGFCGHGFQLGPGVGDAMAELIDRGRCETPLAPFAITRFAA
ncbi:FAD-binding oxidoreductase [Pseudooceanicola sp. CBS1P-1]|uniref:FAD-dependent oxidoreductase n=1 Tax=Pseudooceanicola albus TaxID=2692189 RepID=A0A6L7G5F6_9RHOB|nr:MULTISPECIES: FAD-binding oxidoreductase [Pseudooceanicola]MBT9385118.1 FAD-binding oxidoreductase [Pseudooceanicola endophyticus]MXN18590.1 FAD-dependent oxidoreductase [Pseudooceanicola albus]